MTRRVHMHDWHPGTPACITCGMTRGRAARAAQDRNTILKFLRSAEVGIALHQAKLDPVLYATVMSRLTNVADEFHNAAVAKSVAHKGSPPTTIKATPTATYDPATGSVTVTFEEEEA